MFFFNNPDRDFFEKLYEGVDGYSLSRCGKGRIGEDASKHIIYGELDFKALEKLYKSKRLADKIAKSNSFYDLGSGCGKIVVASSILLPNLQKFVGIELLKELHDTSEIIKAKFLEIDREKAEKIEFINGDFFDTNLADADVIFMHFPMKNAEDLYLKLEEKFVKELKSGSVIISAIRSLADEKHFVMFDKFKAECSYGKTSLYCYYKI